MISVSATVFKNNFGKYLKKIYIEKERIIIKKSELLVLVVMNYQDYLELRANKKIN